MTKAKQFPAPYSHGVDDTAMRCIRAAAMAEAVLDAELDRLGAHHLAATVRTVSLPGPDHEDQNNIIRDLAVHYAVAPVIEPINACALLRDSADPDERVMMVVELENPDSDVNDKGQNADRLRAMRLSREQIAELRRMAASLVRLRDRRERLEDQGIKPTDSAPASSYDIPLHHLAIMKALKIKPDTALDLARQWRERRGLSSKRQWNHPYVKNIERLYPVVGGDGLHHAGMEHALLGLRGVATVNGQKIAVAENRIEIYGINFNEVEILAAVGEPVERIAPCLAQGDFAEVAKLPVESVCNIGSNLMVAIAAPIVKLA